MTDVDWRDIARQRGLAVEELRAEVERLTQPEGDVDLSAIRTYGAGWRDGYAQAVADLDDRDAYLAWWRGQDGEAGRDMTWIEPVAQIRAVMFLRSRSRG